MSSEAQPDPLGTAQKTGKTQLQPIDEDEKTHVLTLHPGAQLTELKEKPPSEGRPQRGGGRRGKVSPAFNRRQQRSMQKTLGKISVEEPAVFVDLTYPENFDRCPGHGFPTEPGVYTNDLKRFLDRVDYRYGIGAVWRLEFQRRRGAPHYHLEIHGLPAGELEQELRAIWLDVIECEEGEQACRATRVEGLDELRRRRGYLAKRDPTQTTSEHIDHVGRSWGTYGRKHIPFAEEETIELTAVEAQRVRRAMETYRDKTSRRQIGSHPHNPSVVLRRGLADEWKRWAEMIAGEREFLDMESGAIVTLEEIDGARD